MVQRYHSRSLYPKSIFRSWYSSKSRWPTLKELPNGRLETFRQRAFAPCHPALLPRRHFLGLPASQKWFTPPGNGNTASTLNSSYLSRFGDAITPLEFTGLSDDGEASFHLAEAPLNIFLQWASLASTNTTDRLYLAQASFASLPKAMVDDLPTPELVSKAGSGDIYDTNIWMGMPPTYTPLHRDPNPNLFVQLAGTKVVRLLDPGTGGEVFSRVQRALGRLRSAAFRGEEMMRGEERKLLESEIWDDDLEHSPGEVGYEVHVYAGDGLFIPKGWWHSIKGVGEGITASVNWWFR